MVERDVARAMAESYPGYLPDYVRECEMEPQDDEDDRWPAGWWIIPAVILGAGAWLLIARTWL